jgi:transcriptional/translational regulatory protein YebC/TACO1
LQKNGGRLGESGTTTHMFESCGIIHLEKDKISEEEVFEIATNAGAKDCFHLDEVHEIVTEKEDFYKIKTEIEKKVDNFSYSAIEWRAINFLNLNNEQSEQIFEILSALEDLDDVQNIFTNASLGNIKQ